MTESPPPPPAAPSDGLSLASLICGILAFPTCLATSLPAIICGHIGLSRAKKCGSPTGKALAGLILGYISIAAIPVIAAVAGLTAPMVIRQRDKADQIELINNSRALSFALMEYQAEHGSFPETLEALESEGIAPTLDVLLSVSVRHRGEWLYFPKADPEEPADVILVSPPVRQKRVVTRVDGSASTEPAAEAIRMGEGEPLRIPAPVK